MQALFILSPRCGGHRFLADSLREVVDLNITDADRYR